MELEKEIQQSKFQNEYQKLLLNIIFTASWLNLRNTQRFKPYGISPQQYNILRILRGQHPKSATVTLLTERMLDKSSNASRLVEKLRVKQLLDRCECPEDRRAVNVRITDKGLALLQKLDQTGDDIRKDFTHISEEEAKLVNRILDGIRE
ncbi:MarR family transcriptional regulator [Rhodocytophaga rosea]|uniref:MarR family transcriptional regulator n=1 Tax=Rhodocytophaga rosea TaxID=2704465 RepID=A0A6C0GF69_9BACT|nr:MarR family transcriptional regulator [Rhodocytophaga rosea]QHT66635.1 MarR family transcriptional regulator [Rhodocytophaga rosea]